MAQRPPMRELPSEAPVDDEEAFASSVEDNDEELDQGQRAVVGQTFKAKTFEVDTTNSEEIDEGGPRDQACAQTGSGELPGGRGTREQKSRSPSKTPGKLLVSKSQLLVLVGALRDRRQKSLRGPRRREAKETTTQDSRTKRVEEQWNS